MTLEQVIDMLSNSPDFRGQVTHWEKIPACDPVFGSFPEKLDPRLLDALRSRGIKQLYSHQSESIQTILTTLLAKFR